MDNGLIFVVLPFIFAIVATILAFVFIVPEKCRKGLNKFGQFLHDTVNFKYLIVEKILQAMYIFATAFIILFGFFLLFYTRTYWGRSEWMGGYGLLFMILGPIAVRLVYEFAMMVILLIKNVIQINNKLKSDDNTEADAFKTPDFKTYTPTPTTQPVAETRPSFCTMCGAKLNEDGSCPICGK